jgi:hypothetical protein
VIELRGERLVVRQHQRRTAQLLDELGHRERLAGAGDAEQHLMLFAVLDARAKVRRWRLLVAFRAVGDGQLEGHLVPFNFELCLIFFDENLDLVGKAQEFGPLFLIECDGKPAETVNGYGTLFAHLHRNGACPLLLQRGILGAQSF